MRLQVVYNLVKVFDMMITISSILLVVAIILIPILGGFKIKISNRLKESYSIEENVFRKSLYLKIENILKNVPRNSIDDDILETIKIFNLLFILFTLIFWSGLALFFIQML